MMYEELMDYIMAYQDILTMANRVIEIWKKEYLKVSNELEQVKAERDTFLKEKAEREKGCEYCVNLTESATTLSFKAKGNGVKVVVDCDFDMKHCPKCGRKLVSEE